MKLHEDLCHPGVTRLMHYVKSKNLPFSTEDIKTTCSSCRTCAELKPQFYKSPGNKLVKATKPMERLSIDFKGPLPSQSRNTYIFTAVDEYSRFPFAIPCSDISSSTVIKCLDQIFSFCGMASFVHSDRGAAFLSKEVQDYLCSRGVASSKTTPYHPTGNSQVERYNGIIWKSVTLKLKTNNLPTTAWETVLTSALHSIRTLLCTSTNETPHERLFNFARRTGQGTSLPTWLTNPGPVFMRRHVRTRKNDPLVDEVELIHANPSYAFIRHPDGRESSVSLRDLAPCPSGKTGTDTIEPSSSSVENDDHPNPSLPAVPETTEQLCFNDQEISEELNKTVNSKGNESDRAVRKSPRNRKKPERFGENVYD